MSTNLNELIDFNQLILGTTAATNVKNLCELVNNVAATVNLLRAEIISLKKANEELTTKLANQLQPKTFSAAVIGVKKNDGESVLIPDSVLAEAYDRNRERCEETRIQNNVVISGVAVSGSDQSSIEKNDKAQIDKILKKLGSSISATKRTFRTTATDPKNSKLIIEFDDTNTKNEVCSKAHTLRSAGAEFNGIFVNSDRTKLQRHIDFKLRIDSKKRNAELTETTTEGRHYGIFDSGPNKGKKFIWAIRDCAHKRVLLKD